MSLKNTEEIRILEQQELAFWRGSASKRLAGWTRDGSAEEIAGWMLEAQRLNREVEENSKRRSRTREGRGGNFGEGRVEPVAGGGRRQGLGVLVTVIGKVSNSLSLAVSLSVPPSATLLFHSRM